MSKNNQQNEQAQPLEKQIIPPKGEEYLREIANIEDMPSPAEDQEAEETLRDEPGKK